jgi:hypothetical protein
MVRFETMYLAPILIGGCDLAREWGRIGNPGILSTTSSKHWKNPNAPYNESKSKRGNGDIFKDMVAMFPRRG